MIDRFPELPLGPPRPVLARAGDALLAHYQLAHGIAPNLGPHIRYAAFFRLFHRRHHEPGHPPADRSVAGVGGAGAGSVKRLSVTAERQWP